LQKVEGKKGLNTKKIIINRNLEMMLSMKVRSSTRLVKSPLLRLILKKKINLRLNTGTKYGSYQPDTVLQCTVTCTGKVSNQCSLFIKTFSVDAM
jgi:hypothetical protein